MSQFKGQITVGITGASGAPYALRLLECLVAAEYQVFVLISGAARVVLDTESQVQIPAHPERATTFLGEYLDAAEGQLRVCGKEEWFSPVASGSAAPKQMVICPCSTGSLAAIANGMSDNLLERAADVVIKERGQLILVPRETPLSAIHLEHMLRLAKLGVTIMPAAPGFYQSPQGVNDLIDFIVARILDHLGLEQSLLPRWGYSHGNSS